MRLYTTGESEMHFGQSLQLLNTTELAALTTNGVTYMLPRGKLAILQGDGLVLYTVPGVNGFTHALPTPANQVFLVNSDSTGHRFFYVANGQATSVALPAGAAPGPNDKVFGAIDFYTLMPVVVVSRPKSTTLYRFDETTRTLQQLGQLPSFTGQLAGKVYGADSLVYYANSGGNKILTAKGSHPPYFDFIVSNTCTNTELLTKGENKMLRYWQHNIPTDIPVLYEDKPQNLLRDRYYNSFYISGASGVVRYFPHIVQYPRLYKGANTKANHFLAQGADGNIYAGSYAGALSRITPRGVQTLPAPFALLPGGNTIGNSLLAFHENSAGGLMRLKGGKWLPVPTKKLTMGYFLALNRAGTHLLAGLAGDTSFAMAPASSIEAGKPRWTYIGQKEGVRLMNILTLTQDRHGRIFFGRTSQGWGVYDSATGRATTYLMQEGTTPFGAGTSLTDSEGRVWMGGRQGLWYRPDSGTYSVKPEEFMRIRHPLLANDVLIGSMKQWRHFLVVGADNNLLLINLHSVGKGKTPAVQYLNPQELNLTSHCEQNTMLVDHRDSTLWLATEDNVYNINLATWLALPKYKIEPTITIQTGHDTLTTTPKAGISLAPNHNSLHINIEYQVPDNMPRYLQYALMPQGEDSIRWGNITLDHKAVYYNRQNGHYLFYVRVYQADGSITTHTFPITIRKYLWQQWWFWLIASLLVSGAAFYIFYLKKKKQLAEANAARLAAEADALRSEQTRQLTTMQVKSLSNQFRPHFILNALNTVGAQLYDKPEVDEVLGQLGDSIGIIFRNAQRGSVAHSLQQEWKLVQSVINIKQMEYRHTVQVHLPPDEMIAALGDYQVPMGILQIPVENALIHGLRNKEQGEKHLWIELQDTGPAIEATITDNGIGRKAAAAMSNFRSHGVGSANLLAIIQLLNQHNEAPIYYSIHDEVIETNGAHHGTQVRIVIPKNYSYAI